MDGEPVIVESRAAPPEVLAYADSSLVPGFSVVREEERICVVVPPPLRWVSFNKQLLYWLLPLAIIGALLPSANAGGFSIVHTLQLLGMIWPATLAVLIFTSRWIDLTRRKLIFEFTPMRVVMRTEHSLPWTRETGSWPLAKLHEIRFSPISGNLIVRVAGTDMRQIYLGPDKARNQLIGDQLSAALAASHAMAAHDQFPDPQPARTPAQRRRRRRLRVAVIYLAAALAACGLLLLPWNPISFIVGSVLILASGTFAGLTVGTQRKEFWV